MQNALISGLYAKSKFFFMQTACLHLGSRQAARYRGSILTTTVRLACTSADQGLKPQALYVFNKSRSA